MNLFRGTLFLAAALCMAALSACNKEGGGASKPRVAIVTNNPEEFWTICEAGARKAEKDFDVELIFRKPEGGDVAKQRNMINVLVNQGVAGVAVSVIDPQAQAPDLKQVAGKVKLITMDNDADGSDRICYVGTDNYAAGKAVGRLVKEAMPEGGTIAIFVGLITPANARQRRDGVLDELAGVQGAKGSGPDGRQYGKYTLYRGEAITDSSSREKSAANARAALAQIGKEKNVCMIGLWAYNPPAILEAVRSDASYKHVKVVGFDEDPKTLDAIESGEMHGTVVQDPFNFGYKSVEILAAEARGDTSKRAGDAVPYRVITKDGHVPAGEPNKGVPAIQFRADLKALLDSAPK